MTLHCGGEPLTAAFTDQYELTMAQAYYREGMTDRAVFELFFREIQPTRNFLLTAGLADALDFLERLTFSDSDLEYLRGQSVFEDAFIDRLADFRFTGDVYAMPEGTVAFADEPVLQVIAPMPEAQIVETAMLNRINAQTVIASKAARVVIAARDRAVVDFGMRRAFGADGAMALARSSYIAGAKSTSNVLAGKRLGIPIGGTMAHSYIQAHDDEMEAFRQFAALYPETVLLVDTYDTLVGIDKVIELARELGDDFRIRAVRLDSGDLATLAKQARKKLDDAGLENVGVFVSGGLDEFKIARMLEDGAPVNGFGVGTRMAVSEDDPTLDAAYKLVAYGGEGRLKTSGEKATLPGRKQVFRRTSNGRFAGDTIGLFDEKIEGDALLVPVMREGRILDEARESLDTIRARAADQIGRLPEAIKTMEHAEPPYPVDVSEGIESMKRRIVQNDAATR